ncbi:hypothetical protein [Streptomyces sp. NPDC048584]|uniref:hypothetical protein n=1 Tax=Streptomyces sp. NPDC048584 TaxID=3365573 RepID=UPI00371176E6
MLQFVLGLSDWQDAAAVRCRSDFQYAMVIESDDPGFHRSVLCKVSPRPTAPTASSTSRWPA